MKHVNADRKKIFLNNLSGVYFQGQQVGQIFQPGGAGYFVPAMPQAQSYYQPPMAQMRPSGRWSQPIRAGSMENSFFTT